ncbi:MAG: non-canonical purine NTP pyrophosphatase, RdgB/HAM1 family [Thiotrichales bacterium 32-46-8]|nr:RdgB/HAM1 family non-canonical purine NTP pyrophosphatase [Gammaproteobacteria bacterium]OYX06639.1 MAG: non-canonical purine NTP pyrophosphatase, RdgB/HAM1 family [Thiotrichales bacterium 32-46-8]OYY24753.1 MAG: non-canonical purine NTP pyrophosphatase, RdgB/HAM1 family [Thiotrichales bacterium 35-46-9]OYZ03824.1 MAG: non-canonical purine NTP pyrophosphatase, RdgB/HAM1 family [Thiotrichales bacterium 16-46-22]OZA18351.1 MAG: non-canonical purine NTP pyrophosphatase, RdgB/HAM1 family [Thiotr
MRCVLASGNAKKAKELTELLAPKGWQVSLQSELGVAQPAEDGLTFVENALIKARAASEQTGLPAIADDSGLVVPALQGAPGIYSARFAGETASDAENNTKLLSVMHDLVDEQRDAYFVSVIVFLRHAQDPLPIVAQGVWHGRILHQSVGEGGFGYDPMFWVPTHACASAQLPAEIKQRISHRGLAMASLLAQLS